MKDFADLDNSSGSFPDVIGVDASGPGETDGTELTADLFNDIFGFFQTILNSNGDTPSGTAESASGISQLLDGIKRLVCKKTYSACNYKIDREATRAWNYVFNTGGTEQIDSLVNSGYAFLPIELPKGGTEIDLTITTAILPGASRSGVNRMNATLWYSDGTGNIATEITTVYDLGTTAPQNLVLTKSSFTPLSTREYFLVIQAGNTGAASTDSVYGTTVDI